MGRGKEEPRGTLAALGDFLAGGMALVDQAQNLGADVQRRLVDVGRGIESQILGLIGAVEERLGERLDALVSGLAVTLRDEIEWVSERVRVLEGRLTDLPKEGVRELIAPIQAVLGGAADRAAAALARVEELGLRLQHVERRIAEVSRETTRDTLDAEDIKQRLDRDGQRLTDLSREVGGKLGELGALRERLTRIEARVLEYSKEQITRTGEQAGLRDRLARLETRLSDLSKEQLARSVETAGLRERLFRLEQRNGPARTPFADPATVGAED